MTKMLLARSRRVRQYTQLNMLEPLPSGLEELFTQTVGSIPTADRGETVLVTLWVLLLVRPLTPTEMRYALVFSQPHKSQKESEASPKFIKSDEDLKNALRKWSRGLIASTWKYRSGEFAC